MTDPISPGTPEEFEVDAFAAPYNQVWEERAIVELIDIVTMYHMPSVNDPDNNLENAQAIRQKFLNIKAIDDQIKTLDDKIAAYTTALTVLDDEDMIDMMQAKLTKANGQRDTLYRSRRAIVNDLVPDIQEAGWDIRLDPMYNI